MFTIRVHVQNESVFMDDAVHAEIKLPSIPRKGDYIQLSDDTIDFLRDRAVSSLDTAKNYFPRWFYGKYRDNDTVTKENLKDLSFEDAMLVVEVQFNEGEDFIDIEIDEDI